MSAPRAIRYISLILALASWAAYAVTRQPAVAAVASLLSGGAIAFFIAPALLPKPAAQTPRPHSDVHDPDNAAQHRTPPSFVTPADTTPDAVVEALLTNANMAGDPVSAHIWVEDTASGTLRLVAATGLMPPPNSPEPLTEGILGTVITEGQARLQQLRRITSPAEQRTVWRYAFPINNAGPRTVAAVDFMGVGKPHSENMNRVAASMAAPLAGAVSLAIAQRREDMVRALVDVAHALSRRLDPDDVIHETLTTAVEISKAATASIMLLMDDRLTIAAAHGLPADVIESTSISVGEGIAGWVAMTEQPLLVEDLPGRDGRGERHGVRSAVSVPIADDDGLLGVLNVGSRAYPAHYDQEHLEVLESLGRQAAVALRNAEALAVAEEMFYGSLRALAAALETKDPYARGGTERVARLVHLAGQAHVAG